MPVCPGAFPELTTCIDPALDAGAYLSSEIPAGNELWNATAELSKNGTVWKHWKVHTLENESDVLTKIHESDQFERLRSRCMVFQKIPTEQPNGAATGSDPKRGADG